MNGTIIDTDFTSVFWVLECIVGWGRRKEKEKVNGKELETEEEDEREGEEKVEKRQEKGKAFFRENMGSSMD